MQKTHHAEERAGQEKTDSRIRNQLFMHVRTAQL